MLSPILFDFFFDGLVRELKELGLGMRVDSGDLLCSLAYADDLVLLADSAEYLQTMVDKVSEWCRRWRLQLNIKKTKVMVFGQSSDGERVEVRSGGTTLEQVPEYKYLGILLNEDGRVGWRPAKEQMLRRARRALTASGCGMGHDRVLRRHVGPGDGKPVERARTPPPGVRGGANLG